MRQMRSMTTGSTLNFVVVKGKGPYQYAYKSTLCHSYKNVVLSYYYYVSIYDVEMDLVRYDDLANNIQIRSCVSVKE